jgi:hypothetical protein
MSELNMVAVQEFAAILRESMLEMADAGWKAHAIGLDQTQMSLMVAQAAEPLVQAIVRKVIGGAA